MNELVATEPTSQRDLSYLNEISDSTEKTAAEFIQDVKEKVEVFRKLQEEFLKAEFLYSEAKKQMEHYRDTVLISSMQSAGVFNLEDADGNWIKLERKYHVSPNKNDKDKQVLVDWLRKQRADFLVKTKAVVEEENLKALRLMGIPHSETTEINSQSLKAFLIDWIGAKGGIAQGQLSDVPSVAHFTCIPEVITS